jgi:Ca2+/Na+ antiporter
MQKITWMLERIMKDIHKGIRSIAKYILLIVAFVAFGQVLSYYDRMEFYLPISILLICLISLYGWYSMEYEWEQKKIVDKLKGNR